MRKIILSMLLICLAYPVIAQDKKVEDKEIKEINLNTEDLEGKAKIGVAAGYPSGIVFGYHLANYMEVNALAGSYFNGFTLGANVLFTLADIKIKDQSFPLSLGPQVNLSFGNDMSISILGLIRWEYSFEEIPLNLYIEAGPGIFFYKNTDFAWASSLGIRYIF